MIFDLIIMENRFLFIICTIFIAINVHIYFIQDAKYIFKIYELMLGENVVDIIEIVKGIVWHYFHLKKKSELHGSTDCPKNYNRTFSINIFWNCELI